MGYPTSVFNPAARSNGQTIDASHINDLQSEVNAVETALLGTITHSVNVSGASTLATLQAAASTFSVRPVTPPPDVARLRSTIVDLTQNTSQSINWTHQDVLTNSSMHSTSATPERVSPQSTGVYSVVANVTLSAAFSASSGMFRLRVLDSSGGEVARATGAGSSAFAGSACAMGVKRFDALGGYVRAEIVVSDGSTHSVSTGTAITVVKL